MQLVPRKYFLLFLAAILVVGLGLMALTLAKRPEKQASPMTEADKEIQQIQTQGNGDDIDDIENDLNETDVIELDKELQDIENDMETTY